MQSISLKPFISIHSSLHSSAQSFSPNFDHIGIKISQISQNCGTILRKQLESLQKRAENCMVGQGM